MTDAQETPEYALRAVVVTASRTAERALDADADVTVITADDIARKQYATVADAVKRVPGVVMTGHSGNGQGSISDMLIINGSDKVVVLVDGMRVNTNGNSFTSADLGTLADMDNVDRIEVLKGSASNLYGSDAQGGVIQIFTKKPKDAAVRTKLSLSGGSFDDENYRLYHEGRTESGFFWTVGAQKELEGPFRDGWGERVINHLNAKSWDVKVGQDFGDENSLVFQYSRYQSDYTRPDYGSMDTVADKGKKDNERMSLQYQAKLNDRLKNQFSLYRNTSKINDNYGNAGTSGVMDMTMRTTGVSDQLTYRMAGQVVTGGIDWYRDTLPGYYDGYNPGMKGRGISTTAFYLQDKWDINEKWSLTPGVRVDHNSQFGTHTSPSISLGYSPNDRTHYYASWKEFFAAPNLYQLYSGYGDPNLDPATGWTAEIGASRDFSDTLSGSVSVFHQHAKNMVGYDMTTWRYANTGTMNQDGVNLSLKKAVTPHFDLGLGYSYIQADKENSNCFANLPKHRLTVDADYHNAGLSVSLSGVGVMDRYHTHPGMEDYSSYWVWDLAADYKMENGLTVFGRVNNLFDQFYTEVGTVFTDPNGLGWYSAPGRSFVAGVSYEF